MPLPLQISLATLAVLVALSASAHAVIYKREPRAATLWVIVAWLLPVVGPVLYLVFGINRVRREAISLRRDMVRHRATPEGIPCDQEGAFFDEYARHLVPLAQLGCKVSDRQLLPGNRITPYFKSMDAYAAMLEAIEKAKSSIALSTYIFDAKGVGEMFVEALASAQKRGVQVRVLVDAMGAKYSRPRVMGALKARGVPVATFNPPFILTAFNLRNHRKILVVDGKIGFTGGLNIKMDYWATDGAAAKFRDSHFRIDGPVVTHLSEVFADDWQFTTREALRGPVWFPSVAPMEGGTIARGIEGGPDESHDRIRWVIIGALNSARKSVRIATPYFIPDPVITSALSAAALRGVDVDVLLPEKSNLRYVDWACYGHLWQTLENGCRVWKYPGDFDHSKLFVVDGIWSMIGSANWDGRSLRLNFELNVESYDSQLAEQLDAYFDERFLRASRVTLKQLNSRPLPIKLRDGVARLFAPFL